jgi:hypothetical protein
MVWMCLKTPQAISRQFYLYNAILKSLYSDHADNKDIRSYKKGRKKLWLVPGVRHPLVEMESYLILPWNRAFALSRWVRRKNEDEWFTMGMLLQAQEVPISRPPKRRAQQYSTQASGTDENISQRSVEVRGCSRVCPNSLCLQWVKVEGLAWDKIL